jgi:hypothetical protein
MSLLSEHPLEISPEQIRIYELTLMDLAELMQNLGFEYYLQCSGALLFYGISFGDYHLDIDLRVLTPGVRRLVSEMGRLVSPADFQWFGMTDLGRSIITTPHFQFPYNGIEVDMAADMHFIINDTVHIEIPNSPEWYAEANTFELNGVPIRVASIEMLLIYYLIIERAKDSGKMDLSKIFLIARSPAFNSEKFAYLISRYFREPYQQEALGEIMYLFAERTAATA